MTIPATGHSYGEPEWTWAEDYSSASAVFTCTVCGHSETVLATVVPVTVAPDCETTGSITYTATAVFEEKTYTDEKVKTLNATGHSYGEPVYTWAEDNSSVTARAVCGNNPEHVLTKTVSTTSDVTKDPTCEETGTRLYTASFTDAPFVTQTREVTIPATGHSPADPVKENENAATCTENGSYDLVVYCSVCHKELSRKTIIVPALGHSYGQPEYEWSDDNSQVTATITCKNDESHVISETVATTSVTTEPTYNTEGKIVYTAEFENEIFKTQTKEVILEAKGIKILFIEPFPVEENPKQLHLEDEENIDLDDIVWTSADESIITVDQNGSVTGIKAGKTMVTASTKDGKYFDSFEVCIQFSDITNREKYYYIPVYWALDNGITTGTSPTTFSPMSNCTRAQVVTFLWRSMGEPEPKEEESPFTDVEEGKYYTKAVAWAYQNDITTGVNSSEFGVGSACTREQVVTFLYRTAILKGMEPYEGTTDFTDVIEGKYYYNAVAWAFDNGITTGVSADRFGVGSTCTRAMIVTFLKRYDDYCSSLSD